MTNTVGQRLTDTAILIAVLPVAYVCAVLLDRQNRKAGQR